MNYIPNMYRLAHGITTRNNNAMHCIILALFINFLTRTSLTPRSIEWSTWNLWFKTLYLRYPKQIRIRNTLNHPIWLRCGQCFRLITFDKENITSLPISSSTRIKVLNVVNIAPTDIYWGWCLMMSFEDFFV